MTVSTGLTAHASSRTTQGARISIEALGMEYATSTGRVRALDDVTNRKMRLKITRRLDSRNDQKPLKARRNNPDLADMNTPKI